MSLWKHNLSETVTLTEHHLPPASQDLQALAENSLKCLCGILGCHNCTEQDKLQRYNISESPKECHHKLTCQIG